MGGQFSLWAGEQTGDEPFLILLKGRFFNLLSFSSMTGVVCFIEIVASGFRRRDNVLLANVFCVIFFQNRRCTLSLNRTRAGCRNILQFNCCLQRRTLFSEEMVTLRSSSVLYSHWMIQASYYWEGKVWIFFKMKIIFFFVKRHLQIEHILTKNLQLP